MTDNSTVISETSFPQQENASFPQLFLQMNLLFKQIVQSDQPIAFSFHTALHNVYFNLSLISLSKFLTVQAQSKGRRKCILVI